MKTFQQQALRFSSLPTTRVTFIDSAQQIPNSAIVFALATWSIPAVAAFRALTTALGGRSDCPELFVCDSDHLPAWFEKEIRVAGKGETLGFIDGQRVASLSGFHGTDQSDLLENFLFELGSGTAELEESVGEIIKLGIGTVGEE